MSVWKAGDWVSVTFINREYQGDAVLLEPDYNPKYNLEVWKIRYEDGREASVGQACFARADRSKYMELFL